MRTNRRGLRIPAVTLALATMVGLCGCSSDDATSAPGDTVLSGTIVVSAASTAGSDAAATTIEISVTVGVDAAPDRIETIPVGSVVKLTVADPGAVQEYHVDGYELGTGVEMAIGVPEVFQFTADLPGDFVVTSHTTGDVLLTLRVG